MRLEWFCSAFVVKKWRVTKMFCTPLRLIKVDLESNKKDIESNKRRLCNIKIDSVKKKSNKLWEVTNRASGRKTAFFGAS